MQASISEVVEGFRDLQLENPILRPQPPTIDESAEQDHGPAADRGDITRPDEPLKPSARQKLISLSSFRLHPTEIQFNSVVAPKSGGKADVAQATYQGHNGRGERVVAVKMLRYHPGMARKEFDNEFVHEVEVLAGLSHKNIVQLVGFVEDLENGTAWVVLSWESNGSVSEFLANGEWEIPERVSLIKDVFDGVKYLHTRQPPICHGDLKSFNILVSSRYRAVITDFGSARVISAPEDDVIGDQSGSQVEEVPAAAQTYPPIHVDAAGNQLTLTGPTWSLRWAAPEVMNGERPGLSSDIWAAGWVCWEVMTDKVPFPELNLAGVITLSVIKGEVPSPREERQLGQIVALCSLMTDCWAFDPKARPNIALCCTMLQWMPSNPPSGSKLPSTDLLLSMGEMSYTYDDYEKAAVLFQQALSRAMSAGDQTATANALDWLGDVYRTQSKYTQAEESYTRAQEIYARIGDDRGQATTLDGLGEVYREQFKYTQAEDSYTRALQIYTRIGVDLGRANALYGLGEVYLGLSKYSEAQESFTRADEICVRIGDDQGRANAIGGLGDVYRLQSKDVEAEESYARAHAIFKRTGDELGRAYILRGIGHLRRRQGRKIEAAVHYTEARDLFSQLGIRDAAKDASHWLAVVSPNHDTSTQASS